MKYGKAIIFSLNYMLPFFIGKVDSLKELLLHFSCTLPDGKFAKSHCSAPSPMLVAHVNDPSFPMLGLTFNIGDI